jgi:hypothetical protein
VSAGFATALHILCSPHGVVGFVGNLLDLITEMMRRQFLEFATFHFIAFAGMCDWELKNIT